MAVFRIGNTGTLVLTTIHADDAISVVDRCAKFGIDGETFAQSVKMIVYTRLINAFEPSDEHERVAPGNMARNWLERGGCMTNVIDLWSFLLGVHKEDSAFRSDPDHT